MINGFFNIRIRKLSFPVALIFGIHVDFLDLLFLAKFTTVILVLTPPLPTTLLLSVFNAFKAKFDNLVVFNKKINNAAIMLKP